MAGAMSNFEERLAASQELIDAAVEDEIADAAAAVSVHGRDTCAECGAMISPARRIAAPFAVRCIECQELLEAEKYHR